MHTTTATPTAARLLRVRQAQRTASRLGIDVKTAMAANTRAACGLAARGQALARISTTATAANREALR